MARSSSQHYVSPSPSYPGLMDSSLAWEESYRQRARSMTRDYVNPNSTRLAHRRSRSADARPQYNIHNHQQTHSTDTYSRDMQNTSDDYRVGCINMIYPTVHESRATLTYDAMQTTYLSQLPRPSIKYHNDFGQTGRSLSPPSHRVSANQMSRTPLDIVDPYETSSAATTSILSNPQSYEYLRNNLIMFGEEEHSSNGTGLSQQELLQRKQKEQAIASRKEKKLRANPTRTRIINLPSTLSSPHSSRQQKQQQQQQLYQQQQQQQQQQQTNKVPMKAQSPSRNDDTTTSSETKSIRQGLAPPSPPRQNGPGPITPQRRRDRPSGPASPDPEGRKSDATNSTYNSQDNKGWRTSMVQRMRTQNSSTGRRWNIIPSLSRSQSRSQSPSRKTNLDNRTGAFPSDPIAQRLTDDGSTEYRLDPPKKQIDPPQMLYNSMDSTDQSTLADQAGRSNSDRHGAIRLTRSDTINEDIKARQYAAEYVKSGRDILQKRYQKTESRAPSVFAHHDGSAFATTQQTKLWTSMEHGGNDQKRGATSPDPPASRKATSVKKKATTRYTMEPKDYTRVNTLPKSRITPTSNRDSPTAGVQPSPSSPFATDTGHHEEMPFFRSNDNVFSSPLNNPPGLDMEQFASVNSQTAQTPNKSTRELHKKTSPTSVMDVPNSYVRWSDNLHQSPTPNRTASERTSRSLSERPKSILRKGRGRSNEYDLSDSGSEEPSARSSRVVRTSSKPASKGQFISEHPSSLGFVDNEGRALSPILNSSFDMEGSGDKPPQRLRNGQRNASAFERNIPEQFQRAFLAKNEVSKREKGSGRISNAYSGFIESVASVVVQTAVRQFLAKRRVERLRASTRSSARTRQIQMTSRMRSGKALVRDRKPTHSVVSMMDLAATRIQSLFRGWYARDCIAVDNYCATIIQKNFLALRCRRKYLYDRYRIIQIQSIVRRKLSYDVFATCIYCAVVIQAAFRGYQTRKNMGQIAYATTQDEHRAATLIQAQWRSFVCEMIFLREYEDILLVQSVARGWVTRRLIRSWLRAHNIEASSTLMGDSPRQQKKDTSYAYSLPRSYINHTEFMKKSLPPPIACGVREVEQRDNVVEKGTPASVQQTAKKVQYHDSGVIKRSVRLNALKQASASRTTPAAASSLGRPSMQRNAVQTKPSKEWPQVDTTTYQRGTSPQLKQRKQHAEPSSLHRPIEETSSRENVEVSTYGNSSSSHEVSCLETSSETSRNPTPSEILAGWRSREKDAISDKTDSVQQGGIRPKLRSTGKTPPWIAEKDSHSDLEPGKTTTENAGADNVPMMGGSWQKDESNIQEHGSVQQNTESQPSLSRQGSNGAALPGASFRAGLHSQRSLKEQRRPNGTHAVFNRAGLKQQRSKDSMHPVPVDSFSSNPEINDEKKDDSVESAVPSVGVHLGRKQPFLGTPRKKQTVQAFVPGMEALKSSPSAGKMKSATHENDQVPGPSSHGQEHALGSDNGPFVEIKVSTSPLHVEMRSRRDESEQRRIDAMHQAFARAGLMGRLKKERGNNASIQVSPEYGGDMLTM